MEKIAFLALFAVKKISNKRMPDVRHMHADLMRAPREKSKL